MDSTYVKIADMNNFEVSEESTFDMSTHLSTMCLSSSVTIPTHVENSNYMMRQNEENIRHHQHQSKILFYNQKTNPTKNSPPHHPRDLIERSNSLPLLEENLKDTESPETLGSRSRSGSSNDPQIDHKKQQHGLQMSFKVKIDKKISSQKPVKLDPESLQDKMKLGDGSESALEQATIAELKELLRLRGLPTTGKKAVLVDRLRTPNSSQRITPLKISTPTSSNTSSPVGSPKARNPSLSSPRFSPYSSIGLSPRTSSVSIQSNEIRRNIVALNLASPYSSEPVNSFPRDDPKQVIRNKFYNIKGPQIQGQEYYYHTHDASLDNSEMVEIQLPSNDIKEEIKMVPICDQNVLYNLEHEEEFEDGHINNNLSYKVDSYTVDDDAYQLQSLSYNYPQSDNSHQSHLLKNFQPRICDDPNINSYPISCGLQDVWYQNDS